MCGLNPCKRHVFFYTCSYSLLKGEILSRLVSLEANIVEIKKDEKVFFK